jgi:hypothetical protein
MLAAAMAPVTFPSQVSRRIIQDYPTWAVREGKSAAGMLEIVVDVDGTVRDCKVVAFVGDERLANHQCDIMKQQKLRPALGPDGNPILGKYRTMVRHVVQGSRQRAAVERAAMAPDLTVSVAGNDQKPFKIDLTLLVEANGSVAACEGTPGKNEGVQLPWIAVACGEAVKLTGDPIAGPSGQPTDYVTNMTVQFEPDSSA